MKRATLAFALTALVCALAVPAAAFVAVTALIEKEKDVFVTEKVDKFKDVIINVDMLAAHEGAAEAQALANQINVGNQTGPAVEEEGQGQGPINDEDMLIKKFANIDDSINLNTGIVGVNQDVGNMVNQANVVAVAVTNSIESVTNSQAESSQFNLLNDSFHHESTLFDPDDIAASTNLRSDITGSVNTNSGVVQVNQNAGNMNNQSNNLALSVGIGGALALSEAALGQFNAHNTVNEVQTVKFDLLEDSVNGNTGIVGVNQSVGNMNNQASAVSVAALTSTVSLTTPFQRP